MSQKRYAFGDRVYSAPVGSRPAFVGVVTYVGHSYYHVRDDDGNHWHRSVSELKPAAQESAA